MRAAQIGGGIGSGRALAAAALLCASVLLLVLEGRAAPQAPSVLTPTHYRRSNFPPSQSVVAQAGNVTELLATQEQLTQGWQGYYGNVTGRIVLDDANNYSIFTWTLVPQGEVYAVWNATTPSWTSLVCLNDTVPTWNDSMEAALMNIPAAADDNFTNTFSVATHPAFNVSTTNGFTANKCQFSIQTYVNDTAPDGDPPRAFNETVLFDPVGNFTVYIALLNDDQFGFNTNTYDFQMVVPEDGWDDNNASTIYYFYLEVN